MSEKQQQQQQQKSGLAGQIAAAESTGGSEAKDTAELTIAGLYKLISAMDKKIDAKLSEMDKKIDTNNKNIDLTIADLYKLISAMDKKIDTKLSEMDKKIDTKLSEMDNKIDTNNAFLNGTYYAPLADIWGGTSVEFNGAADELRKHRSKDQKVIDLYNSEDSRKRFKYNETTYPKISLFPATTLSRAHGCPNDITCSLTWGPNLELITGYNLEGTKGCLLVNEDFRYFVEGQNPDKRNEDTMNTPFKALSWNFLKVPEHHEKHLAKVAVSSDRSMILAPVWDPENEWNPGTPYSLIVAATPEMYKWLLGTAPPSKLSPPIQMNWLSEANDDDLKVATDFLSLTVKANADLLVQHGKALEEAVGWEFAVDPEEGDPAKKLEKDFTKELTEVLISIENGVIPSELFSTKSESTKTNKGKDEKFSQKVAGKVKNLTKKVKSLRNIRKTLTQNSRVSIPQKTASVEAGARILKVDLGKYFGDERKDFIPDPYLWALKAASSWGGFKSQKTLMACDVYGPGGGKTQNDDFDDMIEDPPSEITVMGTGADGERSVSFLSMSSASVCTTDSDGNENMVAVTP